jgi:hypothetical protein
VRKLGNAGDGVCSAARRCAAARRALRGETVRGSSGGGAVRYSAVKSGVAQPMRCGAVQGRLGLMLWIGGAVRGRLGLMLWIGVAVAASRGVWWNVVV